MAIEVNVPDEIADYREKIIAGLSLRQLLFGGIALGIGVPACVLLSVSGFNDYVTMFATMVLVVPPFCLGFINIKGYKFEVYAKIKLHTILAKASRPYETAAEYTAPIEVEEFRPEIQRQIRKKEEAETEQKMKRLEEEKGGFLGIVFNKIKGLGDKNGNEKSRKKKDKKDKRKKSNLGNHKHPESELIEIREKDNKRKRKAAAKAFKTTAGAVRSAKQKEKETA